MDKSLKPLSHQSQQRAWKILHTLFYEAKLGKSEHKHAENTQQLFKDRALHSLLEKVIVILTSSSVHCYFWHSLVTAAE